MIERYRITLGIPLLISFLIVSACSQPEVREPAKQVRAAPYSIATTGDSEVAVNRASTYSWAPATRATRGQAYLGGAPADQYLETALGHTLAAKGYRYSGTADEYGLLVAYRVVLGDKTDSIQPGSQYGINPGLTAATPDGDHYAKGALVITVLDNKTGRTAWRSALQGFADLDIPAHVRQQRINAIVASMLAGFPSRTH